MAQIDAELRGESLPNNVVEYSTGKIAVKDVSKVILYAMGSTDDHNITVEVDNDLGEIRIVVDEDECVWSALVDGEKT